MKARATKPAPFAAVQNFAHPLAKGMLCHWLGNEGAGQRVQDIAGKNDGLFITDGDTLFQLWHYGRKTGRALSFGRGAEKVTYVLLKRSDIILEDRTFSAWIFPELNGNTHLGIMVQDSQNGFFLRTTGILTYRCGANDNNGSSTVTFGKWSHVAVTIKAGVATFYIDAIRDTTTPTVVAAFLFNTIITLGGDTAPSDYFQGEIEDLRLYNRALTQNEIRNLYQNPYSDLLSFRPDPLGRAEGAIQQVGHRFFHMFN